MILRLDRLMTALPAAKEPSPNGAAAVQELLGGKFGEMSTLMNYTYQSFNFRGRAEQRPFYDLIANIAAEEFAHIELVAYAINLLLTGATPRGDDPTKTPLQGVKDGFIHATVVQQPYQFGYQSVKILTALARGEDAGIPSSKVIEVPTKIIKKDNVDAFWSELKTQRGK